MKIKLLLILFLGCTEAFCQSAKNNLSLVFSSNGNSVARAGIGAAGYKGEGATLYGLNYTRAITNHFSVETGAEYTINDVLLDYIDTYSTTFTPQKAQIKMLSVPIFANVSFARFFFANAGLIVNLETSHQSDLIIKDVSGLGVGCGVGARYGFKAVSVFVNPFFRYGNRLINQGIKVGAGYRF